MKEVIKNTEDKMDKCVNALEKEFTTIRAGRANPGVLDKITVDYYGVPTQINAMAAVSVAEARILVIQPWDASSLKAIEKAIMASDIGITPTNDGKAIRIVFPQLTEERRKELCKQAKTEVENAKVNVRNVRRNVMDKVKKLKDKSVPEDEVKQVEKEIQDITDKNIAECDKIFAAKEKEIMSI